MIGSVNKFKILVLVWLFIGCGADSDLLRDQNSVVVSSTPSGTAYSILSKGVYQYKKVNGKRLGFDYYILDTDCKIDNCTLLHNEYIIFDGNVTEQSSSKYVQLGPKGWYDKSASSECQITFNQDNFLENCPDGRETTTKISTVALDGTQLIAFNSNVIGTNDLKDNVAKFNQTANKVNYTKKNNNRLFELLISNTYKCYSNQDKVTALTVDDLTSYSKVVCSDEKASDFILENLSNDSGSVKIIDNENNETTIGNWTRKTVYDNYEIVEINSSKLNQPVFIVYYDGFVRLGKVIEMTTARSLLNKDGFNAIYTQLADKYSESSIIKKELEREVYLLDTLNTSEGYKKVSLKDNKLNLAYGTFFTSVSISNWILTNRGLHRESESCSGNIFFDSYDYSCKDGREGTLTKISENPLEEKLIFKYLKDQKLNFKLDDNNTFFDVDSKELIYRYISKVDSYKFDPSHSLLVGNLPSENNASSLFTSDLYVTSRDKKHYLKIVNPQVDKNGTVEVYSLKSGVELNSTTENNSTFLLNNIDKISTNKWQQSNVTGYSLLKITLTNAQKSYFTLKNDMVLMPFELSTTRVIAGENFESKDSTYDVSFLNQEAYNSVESVIIE